MIKKYTVYSAFGTIVKQVNILKQAMEYKAKHNMDGYIVFNNVKNYQHNN